MNLRTLGNRIRCQKARQFHKFADSKPKAGSHGPAAGVNRALHSRPCPMAAILDGSTCQPGRVNMGRIMCAVFKIRHSVFRPGEVVPAIGECGIVSHPWAGFARAEILDWWQRKGGTLLDIPATEFAERSDHTRLLIWGEVPAGLILRALLEKKSGKPLIRIVTRASSKDEIRHYQHPRMPLLEKPLYEPVEIPLHEPQPELF